ncbi:hypothetical protein K439DRAFT_1616870 [Ramaria rubella]|nr:hypothetical protein K439DRAFT_1616870 [Ramaria rubella]
MLSISPVGDSTPGYSIRDLKGRLDFGSANVFRRLCLDCVSDSLVEECTKAILADGHFQQSKLEFIDAVKRRREGAESEGELADPKWDEWLEVDSAEMGVCLHKLFKCIVFAGPEKPHKFHRRWIPSWDDSSSLLIEQGETWAFPSFSPELVLVDSNEGLCSYGQPVTRGNSRHFWHDRSAFVMVLPHSGYGPHSEEFPNPTFPDSELANYIVSRAADYARLHISARPFQLFSIGLLIFGDKFCVAIFDREGAQLSPICDIWEDLSTLIRVVRRLTCEMTLPELGQDPSVQIISGSQASEWQTHAQTLGFSVYPTYRITMGQGHKCWYTLGPPIWTSLSLLGRGTSVWRVCDQSKTMLVLKNAWRSSERLDESTVYQHIRGTHPGVVEYDSGGDVVFPDQPERVITAQNLRYKNSRKNTVTMVLHRLFLKNFGRPLWEFESEIELLKGVRAALYGHQFLSEQGILHRDINPGNVLLGSNSSYPGFLLDMDCAHITYSTSYTTIRREIEVAPIRGRGGMMTEPMKATHVKFSNVSKKHMTPWTGTLQFMAYNLLTAAEFGRPGITHQVHHDLESFIWVFCYSLFRGWMTQLPQDRRSASHEAFMDLFEYMELCFTRRARYKMCIIFVDNFLSVPLRDLFYTFTLCLERAHLLEGAERLTYKMLFNALDSAIAALEV